MKKLLLIVLISLAIQQASAQKLVIDTAKQKILKWLQDPDYRAGMKALKARKYTDAIKCFEKAAQTSNPIAMDRIGLVYTVGYGFTDYNQGVTWFHKAMELGYTKAFGHMTGLYYDHLRSADRFNKESSKQLMKDIERIKTAAFEGESYAMVALPNALPSAADRLALYKQAADKGNPDALALLAQAYAQGKDVEQDYNKSIQLMQQAGLKGDGSSANTIGNLHYSGVGLVQNFNQALSWYDLGNRNNSAEATENIGKMFYRGEVVKQSYIDAYKAFVMADSMKDNTNPEDEEIKPMKADSYYRIAKIYYDDKDFAKAMELYILAFELGKTEARANIADMYRKGEGVTKNEATATAWESKKP